MFQFAEVPPELHTAIGNHLNRLAEQGRPVRSYVTHAIAHGLVATVLTYHSFERGRPGQQPHATVVFSRTPDGEDWLLVHAIEFSNHPMEMPAASPLDRPPVGRVETDKWGSV